MKIIVVGVVAAVILAGCAAEAAPTSPPTAVVVLDAQALSLQTPTVTPTASPQQTEEAVKNAVTKWLAGHEPSWSNTVGSWLRLNQDKWKLTYLTEDGAWFVSLNFFYEPGAKTRWESATVTPGPSPTARPPGPTETPWVIRAGGQIIRVPFPTRVPSPTPRPTTLPLVQVEYTVGPGEAKSVFATPGDGRGSSTIIWLVDDKTLSVFLDKDPVGFYK